MNQSTEQIKSQAPTNQVYNYGLVLCRDCKSETVIMLKKHQQGLSFYCPVCGEKQ
ncbi:hypothetical protein [Metabacillus iocasae]|uniref:RNA-binding Zn-ribbon protein involved in translation (DUF1610 family) n=1 Tax=Priestia iocasae TaxID=2291674 RepID=A0ABS2QWI1_9BACI|nr:hypothetical protein [Metabacillus iocasae]MBM7703111.1 putative RNA-binding Zn-ribbon protein involved in translation (DUF1610 family) [Metabacillus iocasae]